MKPASAVVHVLHADPVTGAGLAAILTHQPGLQVRRSEAVHPADAGSPAVLVTDYEDGLRRLLAHSQRIDRHRSAQRIVIVTDRVRENEVRRALALEVYGLVSQPCSAVEIVEAVQAARRGQRFLGALVASSIAESLAHQKLTMRESEVLELLARGLCNKSIASELVVAVGTVKSHVGVIFDKLGARTRTQAAVIAAERGLLSGQVIEASRRRDTHARSPAAGTSRLGHHALLQ